MSEPTLNKDDPVKMLVVADPATQGDQLIQAYDPFDPEARKDFKSHGVDSILTTVKMENGQEIDIQIWGVSSPAFSKTPSFYKSLQGLIVVYDLTDIKSFEQAFDLIKTFLNKDSHPSLKKIIVGINADSSNLVAPAEKTKSLFAECGLKYKEIASITKESATTVFEDLARDIFLQYPGLIGTSVGNEAKSNEPSCKL